MIRQERHNIIKAYLAEHDVMTVEVAMELLDASVATVRRDFNLLAEQRFVERTRGGISTRVENEPAMQPFWLREVQHSREKDAVAREAVKRLSPHDVVMIDGGTSTFHLAKYLPDFPLQVITNSVRLAAALGERRFGESAIEVFLTAGHLYPQSGLLIGPQAAKGLAQYHADWAFLSVGGVCESGIYNTNEFVIESEQTMIARADKTVVLADHSKVGRRSMCRICELDAVHELISDAHPDRETVFMNLEQRGLKVTTVEPKSLISKQDTN